MAVMEVDMERSVSSRNTKLNLNISAMHSHIDTLPISNVKFHIALNTKFYNRIIPFKFQTIHSSKFKLPHNWRGRQISKEESVNIQ